MDRSKCALILRGSKIRHNSVVGAGTIVKGIIPENTICYQKKDIVYKTIQDI